MTLNTVVQAAGPAPRLADDDAESVASVRQARFDACFRQYYPRVLAYALRRLPDRAAAEDTAAEAFLIAWRRLDDIPSDPLPWLLGIARHVIHNELPSSRRRDRLAARVGALRGALFRVAAQLPGVTLQSHVKDPAGRTGEAVTATMTVVGRTQFRAIFDPRTSQILAWEVVSAAHGTTWVESRTFLERGIVSSTHSLP